jgi:hypothetical protein
VATPSGRAERTSGPARFARWVCLGMSGFVVAAVFVAHGSVQTFAEAAVAVGVALAALDVAVRLARRVQWREVAGLAALSVLLGSIFERRWP